MGAIKNNLTLIIGLSIPIIMTIVVTLIVYLPGLFIQPKYDFVYVVGKNYPYYQQYSVSGGKIIKKPVNINNNYKAVDDSQIFVYDVVKNTAKEITFSEAERLDLNPSKTSPDGFEITYGSGGRGYFPFYYSSSDYYTRYIQGNGVSKKLNLQLNGSYYGDFQFIGWVK